MSDLDLTAISGRVERRGKAGRGFGYDAVVAAGASADDVPRLLAEVERLRAQLDEVKALHTDSIIGPCPSCYRPGDVSDSDDGLVWWPCPTLRALGKEPVTVNLFQVLGGSGG